MFHEEASDAVIQTAERSCFAQNRVSGDMLALRRSNTAERALQSPRDQVGSTNYTDRGDAVKRFINEGDKTLF
jgi:hypothetical protein